MGDHVREARIRKGLTQAQLAEILQVTPSTVWNWEDGRSSPPTHGCAAIIGFLGYDPLAEPEAFAERLRAFRRRHGLRVKDAAALAEVDPSSWTSWEHGEHRITSAYELRIEAVLQSQG